MKPVPADGAHLGWEPCDGGGDVHVAYRGYVLHWWGYAFGHYCMHHSESPAIGSRNEHNPCSLSRFGVGMVSCVAYGTLAQVDAHIDAQLAAYSPESALVRLERPVLP